jgi:gas vesicle protein
MASTEQLEREAELNRARLAASLEELRNVTPGRVMDEILGYAKSGSADLIRGIGNQVVQHPLPATLIGAGLAWMIMSSGSSSRGSAYDTRTHATSDGSWFSETKHAASSAAGSVGERASSAMHGLKDSAQDAVSGIGDSINSATGAVKDRAQSAMSSLSDTASGIGDSLSNAYDAVSGSVSSAANTCVDAANRVIPSQEELTQAGQRIWDFCKDQPLVVAGLGLAIGAALGSAIPTTEAERRLMGETADQLKQKAQDLVTDPLKSANEMAKSVSERIIDEAAKIAKQEVANLVNDWGSKPDGAVQSDEPAGGGQSGSGGFSSGQGERPFH